MVKPVKNFNISRGETFEELLRNLYESIKGCLSVDVITFMQISFMNTLQDKSVGTEYHFVPTEYCINMEF
jgi:hypothetical protein